MSCFIELKDRIEREDFDRLLELVRRAVNLITDDYKDAAPASLPPRKSDRGRFSFLRRLRKGPLPTSARQNCDAHDGGGEDKPERSVVAFSIVQSD